ncbi:para-nitrobenzyl esterase (carboxylesterase) [Paraphaeosphaeria sporulosa]
MFNNPPLPESEDCLYLNIFTPATSTSQDKLPVLFWIHGGSFSLGSGRLPEYDGSELAANQDVVVVTINYRLNVFGFPASPEIDAENRNLGFLDQRRALAWVSQNIHAFGGDQLKVTIFGESAGGYSVKQLVANPPRPLPFRAAIIQSQARGPVSDNEGAWAILAAELECNSTLATESQLACMRAASADRIRDILDHRMLAFSPTYDNMTDMLSIEDMVYKGAAAKVPILIGTNADEGTVLTPVIPAPQSMLQSIFGSNATSLGIARQAYPANATDEQLKSRILTDYQYTCTTSAIANTLAEAGHRVWRYYFNASFPNTQPFLGAGVWHTSEISLIFGTYSRDDLTSSQQVRLSRIFQRSWASFAKDPYSGPGWASVGSTLNDLEALGADGTAWGQSIDKNHVDKVCEVYSGVIKV